MGDEHGKPTEKDGQEVASKGHRRDKIENINKNTQTVETSKSQPHKKRREGSPISGGIQPRHEDNGKGNGCNTQRNKTQMERRRQQSREIKE